MAYGSFCPISVWRNYKREKGLAISSTSPVGDYKNLLYWLCNLSSSKKVWNSPISSSLVKDLWVFAPDHTHPTQEEKQNAEHKILYGVYLNFILCFKFLMYGALDLQVIGIHQI